ncbi:scoloptoxin SSD14-like isoform X2 [Belonocnema kinseyi]|uniref:scoloptoxin SSD14-like isoform X2 n=1 Tax=Belonocnema kinseyi TaxID=2817044 RepID=UPI00143DC4BC|nr:scoloptoxin SSD14-like isoform X2 [Belonocnema kinseyi]
MRQRTYKNSQKKKKSNTSLVKVVAMDNYSRNIFYNRFSLRSKRPILAALTGATLILLIFAIVEFAIGYDANQLIPPDPENPQPPSWSKLRIFKRGAVCADGPPCAFIGKSILERNGSAVDATLAAMICNGFINMHSLGFGGGFLMTIYERNTEKAYFLDARYSAPGAAHERMYDYKPENASKTGGLSVAVPGELAGYWEAHTKFGKLPWKDLVQPSIEVCENGYNLTKSQYKGLQEDNFNIYDDPTLKAKWREPTKTRLSDGIRIYSAGVPGGGDILAFIMNVLDEFKFTNESTADINSTVITFQRVIETFKYAYAFRTKLGDSDFVDTSQLLNNLTSREFSRLYWSKISSERTWKDPSYYGAEDPGNFNNHGTSHISVLAPNGDAVSITSTVNLYFGSGIVSERTGILLNSGMDDFGLPSRFSYFRIPPSKNNFIKPGKRPLSSMSPTILVDPNGDVKMIIGAAGGTKIITAITFVIMKYLWMENNLKEAVDFSRIHHQLYPMKVIYEYGVQKQIIDGLKKLGHETLRYKTHGSVICAIAQHNKSIFANSDYRKNGDVYGLD